MTKYRHLIVATAVLAVALPVSGAHADPARSGDAAVLSLSAAGKRGLKARGLAVTTVAPASSGAAGLRLPARTVTVPGATAAVELRGALRFRAGRRSVSATALRLSVGASSSSLSAKLGRSRVTLLSARAPATLDTAARSVTFTGARAALTRAAAARLKSALRLRRAPSAATLGRLALRVASATPPARPAPPVPPPAKPIVTATPTPGPPPACAQRFANTPAGSADWFGCDLPGNGDLMSWTDYILRPFPPACGLGSGSVTASGGAQRIDPDAAYDHRFGVLEADFRPDGSATINLQGSVTYTMPAHGIDETIGALRLEFDADGIHGQVYADGRSNPRTGTVCPGPAGPYGSEHVLDLDLTGITPQTSGGVTRWVHVPATIAPDTTLVGGGQYPAGSRWGSFTIALSAL